MGIWRNTSTQVRREYGKCPGAGWVLVKRKTIEKAAVICPSCGKSRAVLLATRDAYDFDPMCITCKRLVRKTAKEKIAKRRPERRCLKCNKLFQPVPERGFLCEHCLFQNLNPHRYSMIEEGWEKLW